MEAQASVDYCEERFKKNLRSAKAEFIYSHSIDKMLERPERLVPPEAQKLYAFVKFCEQEDRLDIPICKEVIRVLKEYERRVMPR